MLVKKKFFLVFVSPLLTLLFFSAHSLHVSRHGWKPIWHKSWDLMEKSNGRFIVLPKEKNAIVSEFSEGRLYALLPPVGVRSRVLECHPWWWRRSLCQSSLDTVKVRGALGERGDGDGVATRTPFNLRWQFQFPAEKDISHLCLKNPNHTVLLINLSVVTLALCSRSDSSTRLGSWCQQLLRYLLLFIVIIKTPLDAGFSVVFTNHLVIFLLLRGGNVQYNQSDSFFVIFWFYIVKFEQDTEAKVRTYCAHFQLFLLKQVCSTQQNVLSVAGGHVNECVVQSVFLQIIWQQCQI